MTDIIFLGVVNATPNSFSDGHKNLDHDFQLAQLTKFQKANYSVDIGAESTAPFNDAISFEQEWIRLKSYLDEHLKVLKSFKIISIDTYKAETMNRFMVEYGSCFKDIIWNDISGNICDEGLSLLHSFPTLKYVYCHNLAPSRELANSHMEYLQDDLCAQSLQSFFEEGITKFKEAQIKIDRIILDPCFGFSKSLEQNLELLDTIHEIKDIHDNWLIGISKKSFLRYLVELHLDGTQGLDIHKESEKYHWEYLKSLKERFKGVQKLYFRVHETGNITK